MKKDCIRGSRLPLSLLGACLFLAPVSARAQSAPEFVSPVCDTPFVEPVLTFDWQVDQSTVFYVMRIQEIGPQGECDETPTGGGLSCDFAFTQMDTEDLGDNVRRLVYNMEAPPDFVSPAENEDFLRMGSGRFHVTLLALQPFTEGTGRATFVFGTPRPEIQMTAEDAKDPRDLRFRLLADDPDDTPDYRYTFTFLPTSGEVPQPEVVVIESSEEQVDQTDTGHVPLTADHLNLVQGQTYDLHLLVEDSLNQMPEQGEGRSAETTGQVRINDLATVVPHMDVVQHYPHSFNEPAIDVDVQVTTSDLDSPNLDVEAVINYVQGADPASQVFSDVLRDSLQTLTLNDLSTQIDVQDHPRYDIRFRATDDLLVTGELSESINVTLNQVPAVESSQAPEIFNYPHNPDLAAVDVPVTVRIADLESEQVRVEVEVFDEQANAFLPSQFFENVAVGADVVRNISLPKAPPESDYAQFRIRVRAIDTATAGEVTSEGFSEFGGFHHIRLNQIPQPILASAPPVVSYEGSPSWVEIPLTVRADDKEEGPLTVVVDALDGEGGLIETIEVGQINQNEETNLALNIDPRGPRRVYDLRVYFRDPYADSTLTELQVRLNQPPQIIEHFEPFWSIRYDRERDDDTIPYDLEVQDDWSDSLTISFEGPGIDESFNHEGDFVSEPQRIQGLLHYDVFGTQTLVERVTDTDGAFISRTITPVVINDIPHVDINEPTTGTSIRIDVDLSDQTPLVEVGFDAEVIDVFGGPLTQIWLFGDLTPDIYEGPPVSHGYNAIGDFEVVFRAIDGLGVEGSDTLLVSVNDRPQVSLEVKPGVYDSETDTWRVQMHRGSTFYAHAENRYRDQDEVFTLERDLNGSDEPGHRVLDSGTPPDPAIPHFLDGTERLIFEQGGLFTYTVTATERFDGQAVVTTRDFRISVEEFVPVPNGASEWQLYK